MPNTPRLPEDVGKRFDKRFYNGMKFHKSLAFNEMALEKTMRDEIRQFLAQELATLKAQVRREIEEQITKMENSNWLHGMGLSGSQAEYIEANIKASYRSIPSLKDEE